MLHNKLYTTDSTGKIRVWQMERVAESYRTISGVLDGAMVTSDWTYAKPKNTNKKNGTSAEQQALLEVEAKYVKQKKKGYSEDIEEAGEVSYVKPMLAKKYKDYKDDIDFKKHKYVVQLKLNGARCIATKDGLYSRKGEKFLTCPHIEESLDPFFDKYPDAVLDGELFNVDLRQKLNEIMSIIRKTVDITDEDYEKAKDHIRFYIYDGFNFGYKLSDHYSRRKDFINSKVFGQYEYIGQVKDYPVESHEEISDIYNEFVEDGHEGAMLRMISSPYKIGGRSKDLLKIKPEDDDEFILVSVQEGEGNWSGKAKILTLKLGDKTFDATFKGTMLEAEKFLYNHKHLIDKPVTIKYNGLTAYGVPNYAQFDVNNQK